MGRKIGNVLIVLSLAWWMSGMHLKAEEQMLFICEKDTGEDIIFSSEEFCMEMKVPDEKAEKIYYQMGEAEYEFLNGNNVSVTIPIGFEGRIAAYSVDMEGNKSSVSYSKEIVCESKKPQVVIQSAQGLQKWYNQPVTVEVDVRESGTVSGIKTMNCMLNGTVIEQRNYGAKESLRDTVSILINQTSDIVVEAEDWAGNKSVSRQRIFFDNQVPQLKIEGAEQHRISGSDIMIHFGAVDEHEIYNLQGRIEWRTPKGVCKSRAVENWQRNGEEYYADETIQEDGNYEIFIEAADQAGNKSEKKLQVMIDKENPVIHGLEKWDGKKLQFFEWTEEIGEVVKDFTTYTYQIYLDGRVCERNHRYTEEGNHTLEMTATDAAGNESTVKVEFVIDHTCAEITDGGIHEEDEAEGTLGNVKKKAVKKIQNRKSGKVEDKNRWWIIGFGITGMIAAGVIWRKKLHKREDAG